MKISVNYTYDAIPTNPLYYYGYRFYNTITGRWLNRDPIEEKGGLRTGMGLWGIAQSISTIWLCLLASSCNHHSATGKIQDLPNGLVDEGIENLSEISEVVRVISLPDGREAGSASIIIPGEVLWCEARENQIIGEKASQPRPVEWMDSNWERAGFFILNPSAINSEASSDEEKFGKAISWFATKQELETAIESTQRR